MGAEPTKRTSPISQPPLPTIPMVPPWSSSSPTVKTSTPPGMANPSGNSGSEPSSSVMPLPTALTESSSPTPGITLPPAPPTLPNKQWDSTSPLPPLRPTASTLALPATSPCTTTATPVPPWRPTAGPPASMPPPPRSSRSTLRNPSSSPSPPSPRTTPTRVRPAPMVTELTPVTRSAPSVASDPIPQPPHALKMSRSSSVPLPSLPAPSPSWLLPSSEQAVHQGNKHALYQPAII